jgi:hypothetical protein
VLKGRETTGINNHLAKSSDVQIFPNPVSSTIYIKTEVRITGYEILNLAGEVVKCDKLSKAIDASSLKPGFYLIKFNTNKGCRTLSFVKS